MFPLITLTAAERQFIQAHRTDDIRALRLQTPSAGLDSRKLVAQIAARQKAREKLPTWYANDALVFPPALSVEQASSERTAHYKASLVTGKLLVDLTGGMGVDTWAFAQRVAQVTYVEHNAELVELAAHNFPLLGLRNVTVKIADGLTWLKHLTEQADWLYLDPHRRDEQGGKVVRLEDCEPDLSQPGIVSALLTKTTHLLVKASPLLDIDRTLQQFVGAVASVHVVAVQHEVKEVLFVLTHPFTAQEDVSVNAVNLLNEHTVSLSFRWGDESAADVRLGDPQRYLYEPNAAVLKAGAFRLVATRFGLTKLAPNSHLYTSADLQPNFPGRIFALQDIIKPDAKALRAWVPTLKANLTVRNFPQSVADLRKKLTLQEGGDAYILATTLLNGDKRLLVTQKVDPAGQTTS